MTYFKRWHEEEELSVRGRWGSILVNPVDVKFFPTIFCGYQFSALFDI